MEPLLDKSEDRLILFPVKYPEIFEFYKKHLASFWVPDEITKAEEDRKDWNEKLTKDEQKYVKNILAFFAASDNIVIENLASKFCEEVQIPEARQFYSIQIGIEAVHSHVYCLLIDRLVKNPAERNTLFRAIQEIPIVRKKAQWALKWINNNDSFAERLVGFACVERLGFISSFAGIFWLRKRNLLPGVSKANLFIARDESLHGEFACYLYLRVLRGKLSEERVREIVKEATDLEIEFATVSLPVDLIGLNKGSMSQYIRYVADHLLLSLGYSKMYGDSNPFPWMETMSVQVKNNFFEDEETGYQKAGVMDSASNEELKEVEDF